MVHNNGPKVKINFGAKYTSEYKQAKPKSDGLVTLPIIHPHKLDDLVYSIPSKRLLTVCLISDKYSESRPGMKMLRWAASKMWRHEKKQLILNEKEDYESKTGKSSSYSLPTSESETIPTSIFLSLLLNIKDAESKIIEIIKNGWHINLKK